MSAPFQYTPQASQPYPQPPPLSAQWYTPQQQQRPQPRRQPRFDPNSFAAGTGTHPRPPPRPPTPYARKNPLPDTPYAPFVPSYQSQQSYYNPQPYSPWVPVIPPDFDDDSSDKEPHSPLARPPGPNNLQPRPHYWRSRYPNKRYQCPLSRIFSQEQQIRLNALLHYKSKKEPPMRYDLCVLPSRDHQFSLPAFHRRPSPRDMRQFATDPPIQHLRLWHHLLPWYIEITATANDGDGAITIGDLLEQLHSDLRRRISPYDYWTTALTPEKRKQLDDACTFRVSARGPAEDQAICLIDFLDREFLFVGMIPCSNGTFEFKTIPIL